MSAGFARFLRTERIVALSSSFACAGIVVGVNAAYAFTILDTDLFIDFIQVWPVSSLDPFTVLNIVVASLAIITIPVATIINFVKRGVFTSMIMFELTWLGVLDVLWVATAAYTTHQFNPVRELCSIAKNDLDAPNLNLACDTLQVSIAFSFASFSIITIHLILLLALALNFGSNGVSVWPIGVRDVARLPPTQSTSVSAVQIQSEQTEPKPYPTNGYVAPIVTPNTPHTTYTPSTLNASNTYVPTTYTPTAYHDGPTVEVSHTAASGRDNIIQV